jgi:hypothetical protein
MSPKGISEQAGSCRASDGAGDRCSARYALQDGLEMAATEDEGTVEALAAQRSYEPFCERVRQRCPDRRADHLGAFGGEHLIKSRPRISSRGPG